MSPSSLTSKLSNAVLKLPGYTGAPSFTSAHNSMNSSSSIVPLPSLSNILNTRRRMSLRPYMEYSTVTITKSSKLSIWPVALATIWSYNASVKALRGSSMNSKNSSYETLPMWEKSISINRSRNTFNCFCVISNASVTARARSPSTTGTLFCCRRASFRLKALICCANHFTTGFLLDRRPYLLLNLASRFALRLSRAVEDPSPVWYFLPFLSTVFTLVLSCRSFSAAPRGSTRPAPTCWFKRRLALPPTPAPALLALGS
mmetsp:Transcript_46221/g.94277  ORF Transcript_46221/g.94277 Transcript_46221/m.94277 type:complete len:259 (-) Transcript_46221:186-962(-)